MKRSRAKLRRPVRRGIHTVELAIVLPIVLLLVFCGYEFGRANLIRNMASSAAYAGAREAVVAGATASEAQGVANSVMGTVGIHNANVAVTPSTITPQTASVRVVVTVPFSAVTGFGDQFLSNLQIAGECELTREGF